MAELSPSPDTQAALADQVSGAFAGEAKFQSGKITRAQKEGLSANINFQRTEDELRGLREARPLVLDAALDVVRGLSRFVEWRANRITTKAIDRKNRADRHAEELSKIRQRTVENEEARRKATVADEVLRVLDLPGAGEVKERPPTMFEGLRERWNQYWAGVDARRARKDIMSAQGYKDGAAKLRAVAVAMESGWRTVTDMHQEGLEKVQKDIDVRRQDVQAAANSAQQAFESVMQRGPAEATAARAEVKGTSTNELATQQQIVEQRTANIVSAANNP